MLRKTMILAALAASAVAAMAGSASAATYIHGGTATGNLLASGTAISASLRTGTTAVLTTSLGNVTCTTGGFRGRTTSASGGASVSGVLDSGAAGLFFGNQTGASTCTDSIFLLNVTKCYQSTGRAAPIVATATGSSGGSINLTSVTVTCELNAGGPCEFVGAPANGTFDNTAASATYTNVPVTSSTGGVCPTTGRFTASFAPVKVVSSGANVVLNTTP